MNHKYVVDGKRVILENRPLIHYKYHGEAMARSGQARPGQARPDQARLKIVLMSSLEI